MFAARYYTPDRFSITAGVSVPVDQDLLDNAVELMPQLTRRPREQAIEDRRFAEAIYRAAIAAGIMNNVRFLIPEGVA